VPGTEAPEQLQIGAVAERTGLSIRTLRHYDEVGLVPPSARTAGGFRLYTADDVARLTTIRRMKPLGFTLDEMRTLLASLDVLDDPASSADARREAVAFVADCHARAEESCRTLRRQLAYAEEFRDLLAAQGHTGG
jgi:MerR family transcriptional regulator, copper efflux regulator